MTEMPEDIRAKAGALADQWVSRGHHDNAMLAADFAEAIHAERQTQRDRIVKMLVGVADVLADKMVSRATPELLKALADAVKSSDEPDPQTP